MMVNPKTFIKSIDLDLIDGFYKMGDSMCYDSGTTVLSAKIETTLSKTYEVYIEAQGHVKVFWHGDMYKSACQMPEELIYKFENGTIDEDDDYDCVENNWWEVVVYRDGKYLDWCGGLMDCNPNDFLNDDDVKEYLIDTISNDFDRD